MGWGAYVLLGLIQALAFGEPSPVFSRSNIPGPSLSEIYESFSQLEKKHSALLHSQDLGKTPDGHALTLWWVGRRQTPSVRERPAILISSLSHGTEYLGVEAPALESVLWELSSQKGEVADFIDAGGALVFIPVVNPDGYARQDRYNAEGLDLNRHWNESEQSKETRAWKKGLDGLSEGAPSFRYVYSIDYHCCRSVALIPETVERDLSHQPRVEKLRAFFKKVFRIPVGNTENLLGYASQGTLKDYLWEKFGTLSVTYEGTAYHEPKQWNLHKRLWKKLMAESLDAFKQKDQAKVPALVRN